MGMLYGKLKEFRVLVTFPSLTEVFGAERIFKRNNCPYESITTPRILRSGCNVAFCFPLERRALIEDLIDGGVVFTGVFEAREDGFFLLGEED